MNVEEARPPHADQRGIREPTKLRTRVQVVISIGILHDLRQVPQAQVEMPCGRSAPGEHPTPPDARVFKMLGLQRRKASVDLSRFCELSNRRISSRSESSITYHTHTRHSTNLRSCAGQQTSRLLDPATATPPSLPAQIPPTAGSPP